LSEAWQVVLPETWRVRLMRAPGQWQHWRAEFARSGVPLRVLDWEDALGDRLLVAALDLSTAELLLKLPPAATVVAIDHVPERPHQLGRGVQSFLARARAVGVSWVAPVERPVSPPWDILGYLGPALGVAGGRR
jgi:hypothetical protein